MLANLHVKRYGVLLLEIAVVLMVLVATVLSLLNPLCCARTLELTFDGMCVGLLISTIRLLNLLRRPHRLSQSLFSWWCLARVLYGGELRYGFLGGYLLGVTHAVFVCLAK